MAATRPSFPGLTTRGLSSLSQMSDSGSPAANSPAEQRDDAKRNMLKAMRPLQLTHVWNVYFDKPQKDQQKDQQKNATDDGTYSANLEQLGKPIKTVQEFWGYNNNTPVSQMKMGESVYLFKQGIKPIWEDRHNIDGGSLTFIVPKEMGPDFWTRIQCMAVGEKLQDKLDKLGTGDQLCGVGLSVRFSKHNISIWHRDASENSKKALLETVLEELPEHMKPKDNNSFYKKHSAHKGFQAPAPAPAQGDSAQKELPKITEGQGLKA